MRLLRPLAAATLVLGLGHVAPVLASPTTDALTTCLTDNTTGKDRKDLARWIYIAMAAHPEMHDISSVTDDARDQSSQAIGQLLTHLLAESCPAQTKAAVKADGGEALKSAFGALGQLAMAELMANQQVSASMSGFERYLDRQRLGQVVGPGL